MAQPSTLPPLVRGEWLPMTWEEFVAWSPDEGQSEWVDGAGIAHVSNSERHVRLVVFPTRMLGQYVAVFGLGEVFAEALLMRLPSRPSGRMPDVMVVGNDARDRVLEYWLDGPALLVVEVVSEESAARDLVEKRAEYERAGIAEYPVVEARPGHAGTTLLRLDPDGRY